MAEEEKTNPKLSETDQPNLEKDDWWTALESNPKVFNQFVNKLGLSSSYWFEDIYSLDEEYLCSFENDIIAFVLIYPTNETLSSFLTKYHSTLKQGQKENSSDLIRIYQHKEFGHACGYIACLHCVCNCVDTKSIQQESLLSTFLEKVKALPDKSPQQVGWLLLKQDKIRAVANECGQSKHCDTAAPVKEKKNRQKLGKHYTCFILKNNHVIEMNGKGEPIDHGPVDSKLDKPFLSHVRTILLNYVQHANGKIDFSLIGLLYKNEKS
ncbi:hypothetical protein RFI_05832 [Reticulomyxa filosa]|uniref:Ubiquitin carboxyl-terminal hydrolase n=1 Tax=Reticulomyxa filosa TaxID=46433 RepID=X6NZL7_RETFI|nr:hypothetical protein RFI_05832 [Reticulomyxa filosa]|eukprot:ETO31289.1 hypothetical protein RFI_05832 [Reticulomyxa filosa]